MSQKNPCSITSSCLATSWMKVKQIFNVQIMDEEGSTWMVFLEIN